METMSCKNCGHQKVCLLQTLFTNEKLEYYFESTHHLRGEEIEARKLTLRRIFEEIASICVHYLGEESINPT